MPEDVATLEAAVAAARADPQIDAIAVGAGEWTIDDLVVDVPLDVHGAGDSTVLRVGPGGGDQVGVRVQAPSSIRDLVIAGGERRAVSAEADLVLDAVTIRNSRVTGQRDGGAVQVTQGTTTIGNSTLADNWAGDKGGHIAVLSGARLDVRDSVFLGGDARDGGSVWGEGASISLTDVVLVHGHADGAGGQVAVDGGTLALTRVVAFGSSSDDGGVISAVDAVVDVTGLLARASTARRGGVLHLTDTWTTLESSVVCDADATDGGGAVYLDGGSLEVRYTVVAVVEAGSSAAVRSRDADLTLINVTVAQVQGDGVDVGRGSMTVTNTLVGWVSGTALVVDQADVDVGYDAVYDNDRDLDGLRTSDVAGLVDADPMLALVTSNCDRLDVRPAPGSPLVDAGDPGLDDTDGSRSDIGAYTGELGPDVPDLPEDLIPDADADGSPSTQDCDDSDPDVYPGAPEVSGDGIDQDCTGFDADAWLSGGPCGLGTRAGVGLPVLLLVLIGRRRW